MVVLLILCAPLDSILLVSCKSEKAPEWQCAPFMVEPREKTMSTENFKWLKLNDCYYDFLRPLMIFDWSYFGNYNLMSLECIVHWYTLKLLHDTYIMYTYMHKQKILRG